MSKPKLNFVGQLKPAILSYKWEIQNFCTGCKKQGEYVFSPKFSSNDLNKHIEWRLKLYPKGHKDTNNGYLSLFLEKCADELKTDYIVESMTLSILNESGVKAHQITVLKKEFNSHSWGASHFIHRNDIMNARKGLLKDDTLTILCEIIFDPKFVTTHNDDDSSDEESSSDEDKVLFVAKTYEANYKKELKDFERLLENETFSDVTFTIGDQKIGAHKAILVSRSPVFQAMLETNTKKSKANIVDITDIKYEVMKELLRFIYSSTVNDINSLANELLPDQKRFEGGYKGLKGDL